FDPQPSFYSIPKQPQAGRERREWSIGRRGDHEQQGSIGRVFPACDNIRPRRHQSEFSLCADDVNPRNRWPASALAARRLILPPPCAAISIVWVYWLLYAFQAAIGCLRKVISFEFQASWASFDRGYIL
ncbi:hypothetical protein Dimus_031961, partial [Dionaea muscipula]